jgi:hypothetical protein
MLGALMVALCLLTSAGGMITFRQNIKSEPTEWKTGDPARKTGSLHALFGYFVLTVSIVTVMSGTMKYAMKKQEENETLSSAGIYYLFIYIFVFLVAESVYQIILRNAY